jgi:glyoxylase-like metal-dependent hydrolase (beta-lactamase superfamily II)
MLRRRGSIPAILVLAAVVAVPAGAQSFDIVKVAEGVYAAIGRPGVASNGAFIVNKEEVLVVDTHFRPSWARDLIAEIRKVTDRPVRFVVNTHWHNDHTQGNQAYVNAFGPGVEYLAQHRTREDIAGKAIPGVAEALQRLPDQIGRMEKALAEGKNMRGEALTPESRKRFEDQIADQKSYLGELQQIQITLPTITFERSLVLHRKAADGSDRSIHIYFFGKAHTRGDVVVYLPKERVVVTGDLLTNGIPFMRDAYPSQWVDVLVAVAKLDWKAAIPGHGPMQEGKGQIQHLVSYMLDMVTSVKDAITRGVTQEDAKKTIDLSKYAAGFPAYATNPQGFQTASGSAIDRTWAELTGKIPD